MEKWSSKTVQPENLSKFCVSALRKCGLSNDEALISAEVLVTTDLWGVHSHGTKQLLPFVKNFRYGSLRAGAMHGILSDGPTWALLDGKHVMPLVVSTKAMQIAIEKARNAGIAYVGVQNSGHFGAAGYYAVMAAMQDMIGIAMCNTEPIVTVPGGKSRVIGTNPIAYAIPAGEEKPVFLDIATSAVAISKIFAAKDQGKLIPDNWLIDEEGNPTSEPTGYPMQGAMLPMAGHKGYGLAILVEVLSGVLTGAGFLSGVMSWLVESQESTNQGLAFIAIDVGKIVPVDTFKNRMDQMIREIKTSPRASGVDQIYLPGEMEWQRRDQALKNGIRLPEDALRSLYSVANELVIRFEDFFPEFNLE